MPIIRGLTTLVVLTTTMLWQVNAQDTQTEPVSPVTVPSPDFVDSPQGEQANLFLNDFHTGLGFVTEAAAMATGICSPERAGLQVHQSLAWITAGLAFGTMIVGLIAHWDGINNGTLTDSGKVHAILGAIGGTMMMITPFLAPNSAHKYLGELGALTMGVAIVWKIVF